ncbi:MAG TPA: phosphatase PAP2 family protein [Thermoleophilaceae bacterium]|nr:phosphatase PAP2 family protein [Thermoleophilaceae bacterium]
MLGELDVAVLRAFRTRGHTPARERAVAAFSRLGEQAMLWLALCAGGAVFDENNRSVYKRAAKTIFGTYACNQLIKVAVRRHRPRLEGLPPLAGTLSGLSYPSAHAATSFAGARMLSPVLPAAPLYATAVGLVLSRLYLGLHYPSDIVAGAALGASVGELAS